MAFYGCKLKHINIEQGVEYLYKQSFSNCEFTDINLPSSVKGVYGSFSGSELKNIVVPQKVVKIPKGTYSFCDNLTNIEIPNQITDVGEESFSYCDNLETIIFPKNLKKLERGVCCKDKKLRNIKVFEGVLSIEDYAFEFCESITNFNIPSTVKTIGDSAFFACKKLNSITIPQNLKSIGNHAFGFIRYYEEMNKGHYEKKKGFTIKGYKGTAASKYAKKYGFKFVALN